LQELQNTYCKLCIQHDISYFNDSEAAALHGFKNLGFSHKLNTVIFTEFYWVLDWIGFLQVFVCEWQLLNVVHIQ